jgi:hypothetical protein
VEDRSKDKYMHKTSMIVYKLRCRNICSSGSTLWNSEKEGEEKRVIERTVYTVRCEGGGYEDGYWKLLKNGGVGSKGEWLGGLNGPQWSKPTVGTHWDTPLNVKLNIGEGRRLGWQYIVDGFHVPMWSRTGKPLAIALSGVGRGLRGETRGAMQITYNISLIGIVTTNPPPVQWIYPNKKI